jgi:hypothetical protein
MTNVIPLHTQLKALHPSTGKPCTVVGIDTTSFAPRLIILNRGPDGIEAEIVDYVDNDNRTAA